jgi:uncharacterized protein
VKLGILLAVSLFAADKPRIAVVIDDFGLTYKANVPDEDWYALDFPATFAVMPESPRTKEAARRTKEAGHELIIHFPFDPFLTLDLDKRDATAGDLERVRKLLDKSFKDIPGPVGINNHRSYKATQNRPLMAAFMPLLKDRGVYFLDSVVSNRTVAYDEARSAGLPALKNTIFIDTAEVHTKDFCAKMLRRASVLARKNGSAIAIGHHYFHGTYDCLREQVPLLRAEGFEFVKASALVTKD